MKSSFVERLNNQGDLSAKEDFKFFGIEPQSTGRALNFELRFKSGRCSGLPYSYVTKWDYEPSDGIEIHVSDQIVRIKGRNLKEVFTYLLQNRLTYICEDLAGTDTEEEDMFVESIEVQAKYDREAA